MSALPSRVNITEVAPRDGLQNEPRALAVDQKVAFIDRLSAACLKDIEVSSFVRLDRVPQLSDATEVFQRIRRAPDARYWALIPNQRGYERARAAGVEHLTVFSAATDGFSRANANVSVEESLARLLPIVTDAVADGLSVRGYVSVVFGCPYDGRVAPESSARVSKQLLDAGCHEISLGDTIGVAVPTDVRPVIEAHESLGIRREQLALHFHDTFGTALANVYAGLQAGIVSYDSSAGGLGGCPYAPGATGNLATEDLLYMLNGLGIETGVDLDTVMEASAIVEEALGTPLPSRAHAAIRSKMSHETG
jgi:hydroxymethylglutaryl-CoA lyase